MEELLTTGDVSKLLDISTEWVRTLERQGRLPALRTRSGQRLFLAADVQVFAQQRAEKQERELIDAIQAEPLAAAELPA